MQSTPQGDLLRDLVAFLQAKNLPMFPRVRRAFLVTYQPSGLEQATVTCVPLTPEPERIRRDKVEVVYRFGVALQRAVRDAGVSEDGTLRDFDDADGDSMLECQRQLMLALYGFRGVVSVEANLMVDPEHAQKGVWTSAFTISIRGSTEVLT